MATPIRKIPATRSPEVDRERLIALLNEDLAREYQAVIPDVSRVEKRR